MSGNKLTLAEYINARLLTLSPFTAMAKQLGELLNLVCDESCIFPTINLDGEGGISAVWHAKEYSLEIFVESDAVESAVIMRPPDKVTVVRMSKRGPKALKEVSDHLRELSAYVQETNSRWRELVT